MIFSGRTQKTPSESTFRADGKGAVEALFLNSSHNVASTTASAETFYKSGDETVTVEYSTFLNDTGEVNKAVFLGGMSAVRVAHSNFNRLKSGREIVEVRNTVGSFEECYFAGNTAPSLIYVTYSPYTATLANCFVSHAALGTT
jgi:hypothetical protein